MTTANLASNLVKTASGLGDSVALRVGPTATTYAELDRASSRVAGMLRERGLKPGDPVGIMLPNVAEFAVIYYGVLRVGCAVVPMNPLLKAREVAYYLGDSGARLVFAWHAFAGDPDRPRKAGSIGTPVRGVQMRDHVKAQVAAYKYPRTVWIVNELPKGPAGKIVKREIVPSGDQGT